MRATTPKAFKPIAREANVYVACWGDDFLLRVNPDTLTVMSKAVVGDGPRAFGKFLR